MARASQRSACVRSSRLDWPSLVLRAGQTARQVACKHAELPPVRILLALLRLLPPPLAGRRLRFIRSRGWHRGDTPFPDDAVDRRAARRFCPDWEREFWRLALLGPPGQGGGAAEESRRGDLFARHAATIRLAMTDFAALSAAATRVLDDPEVKADATLRSLLRTFIAQRQAELHNQRAGAASVEKVARAAAPAAAPVRKTTFSDPELYRQSAQWIRTQFTNLRLHFEDRLAHYDEAGARRDLEEMRALYAHNPGMLDAPILERCVEQFERLKLKVVEFRERVDALKAEALEEAHRGCADKALWITRRLSAIHDMLPEVLSTERFHAMHAEIQAALKSEEHHEALNEILSFERSVAEQIKALAGRIYRFHVLSQREPHDSSLYLQARQEYDECVRAVLKRDEDWLAGMMLKLDSLLEDLEDDRPQAERQVERFIENVRSALIKVRREIIAIRNEDRQTNNKPPP